jgi:hypothetical protein
LKTNSGQLSARWRKLQDQRGRFKENAGRFAAIGESAGMPTGRHGGDLQIAD